MPINSDQYTFIDLFAGCGGLSCGLEQAGLKGVWAIDIDENACETYRCNLGDHIYCGDIRDIDLASLPDFYVMVGGFPCQPFSVSGLQHGFDGKDGDLFYQCARVIKHKQPKVFMLENVSGFATLKNGYYLNMALSILSGLGYHVSWKLIDCSDYEIPQTRKRIIILGNRLGVENIYPQPSSRKISVKEAIDDIWQNPDLFLNNEPMKHTPRIVNRFAHVKPGETALDAMKRDPSLGSAKITKQCYRRMFPDEPAPTIVANFVTTTIHYSQNRNLTAREAARIQTFPDDFVFKGYKTRMSWQKSLSQFEQIGNAVPPRLGLLMGECIITMLGPNAEKLKESSKIFIQHNLPFDDIEEVSSEVKPSLSRGKTHTNRGRRSKYTDLYVMLEKLGKDECYTFSDDVPEDFFVFLVGAMRRRNIKYELIKKGDVTTFCRRS